ncbi:MAG TPA: A24 family peptidase [Streptosporangiaceae bacterium]|nr:A24 family peptidase [Streptosporangiaceae bacterium]
MNLVWAAAGAIAGLPAGTVLRGPVFRLSVPSGEPERSACQNCAAPVPAWIALRCRYCGSEFGPLVALELVTAAVLALLLARFGDQPEFGAFALLGVVGVALAVIDAAVQRLPDLLTLPAYPAIAILLGAAAITEHDTGALARALLGSLALAGGYLLLALLRAGQLGGGDIKLALLVGLALGWLGWGTLFIGASLGFVLAAVVGLALLARRRVTLQSAISFGPYLLGGALLAILASGQ